MRSFSVEHTFIESNGGFDAWGAMAVGDFDGDGRVEFATGGKGGGFYHAYDFNIATASWERHVITNAFSPNAGATAADLDGDGRDEIVCGEWGPRLFWIRCAEGDLARWEYHCVYEGLKNPHDVLAADLNGDGRSEILIRNKDGALLLFRPPENPRDPWPVQQIADSLTGDGTAVAAIARNDALDIVTNQGWFENRNGDGTHWVRHPVVPEDLDLHPECRLVVGDLDGDGRPVAVIAESEIPDGRLFILRYAGPDRPWEPELLIDRSDRICAMHSLQLTDFSQDGKLGIFTAEMENGRTDGVNSKPRWWYLERSPSGGWKRHVLLDKNLGSHSAAVADYDGDGQLEIVGKVWRANQVNGANGKNHVDFLRVHAR